MNNGISGKIANAFLKSKLTVLLIGVFMAIGIYSVMLIPSEEEPQIQIPIADVYVQYPGANPKEVENRVAVPLEKMISNIKGVEYVYSTSMNGQVAVIVQFYVGEDIERSIVKLYDEINKNMDKLPQGVSMPLVKTRSIDDVPMMSLTLWSDTRDDYMLKQIGEELASEIKKVPDVANINTIGGRNRQIQIEVDKSKLASNNVDLLSISKMFPANNVQLQTGNLISNDSVYAVQTGVFLNSKEDVAGIIIGNNGNNPVYLDQVATVYDGAQKPSEYVSFGYGKSSNENQYSSNYPAVTLAINKKKGADAKKIATQIEEQIKSLHSSLITDDIHISITRNYGETASAKVDELLMHLGIAIFAVTILVMLAMGWRGGLVVFLSVPTTFALTLFAYYVMGYTLNRITLFALVFVVGIVVDDSIIIAENMHRHFHDRKLPFHKAAIFAINEVGNPTILATFTVIAAILPMAFVSGMMGPYMSPMPIGASIAMLFSLIIALTITPYLGYKFLLSKSDRENADKMSHKEDNIHSSLVDFEYHGDENYEVDVDEVNKDLKSDMKKNKIYQFYNRFLLPLLNSKKRRYTVLGLTFGVLMVSMLAFYFKWVAVKMLPFDNKNEFQVVVDMPEGTSLERTNAITQELANYLSQQDNVVSYQTYVGTSSPITFNGLVRHYDIRRLPNQADIQVNLTDKHNRSEQSHDIAKLVRPQLQKIAQKYNANVKVVEVPPGPPVLSTIVAEIYGPDYNEQVKIADQIKSILSKTPDVVDVDWYVEKEQPKFIFDIDKTKSMSYGIAPAQIAQTMNLALGNQPIGALYSPSSANPINVVIDIPNKDKTTISDIGGINITSQRGESIPLSDLVNIKETTQNRSIYRKNQREVVYVTADMAGELESPVYAIMDMENKLKQIKLPKGYSLEEKYMETPDSETNYGVKWDGEWQITLEVFRDLGIAFAIVILIIYILIVGWFQNFKTPVIMMIAIPLSLIGIVVGHMLLGAYFTATSMIGFIALAGVMVRNSVLLIDFINIRLEEKIPLKEAILEAGAVRTIPILLTAGAVAIGALIILFDPIFQGLAISLIGGTIASTLLTLIVVPTVFYMVEKNKYEK
ncbi:MAG: efflux RND transporter permease subunit [Flavobacteriales bacterium]|nr:efflux RND transporter permease subunit [Flavobacteriales bacterium]